MYCECAYLWTSFLMGSIGNLQFLFFLSFQRHFLCKSCCKYSRDLKDVLNVQGIIHYYFYTLIQNMFFSCWWAFLTLSILKISFFKTEKVKKFEFLAIKNVCQHGGVVVQTYCNFESEKQCIQLCNVNF